MREKSPLWPFETFNHFLWGSEIRSCTSDHTRLSKYLSKTFRNYKTYLYIFSLPSTPQRVWKVGLRQNFGLKIDMPTSLNFWCSQYISGSNSICTLQGTYFKVRTGLFKHSNRCGLRWDIGIKVEKNGLSQIFEIFKNAPFSRLELKMTTIRVFTLYCFEKQLLL